MYFIQITSIDINGFCVLELVKPKLSVFPNINVIFDSFSYFNSNKNGRGDRAALTKD